MQTAEAIRDLIDELNTGDYVHVELEDGRQAGGPFTKLAWRDFVGEVLILSRFSLNSGSVMLIRVEAIKRLEVRR